MKIRTIVTLAVAVSVSAQSHAQDSAADAAEDAAEAVAEAAADAMHAVEAASLRDRKTNKEPFPKESWYPRSRPADYPASAYENKEEGNVAYALLIDAEGNVTGCEVVESNVSAALNVKTCEVALRDVPAFEPAKNEQGVAIARGYERTMNWRIREPDFDTMAIDVAMQVNKDGSVSNCEVLRLEGKVFPGFKKEDPCKNMNNGGRMYRDENGEPIAKRVRVQMIVDVDDVTEPAEQ